MTLQEMLNKTYARQRSFEIMIEHLDTIKNPLIVETGCARQEDNFAGDGMSTLIFDRYIYDNGGEFHSVDINPSNIAFARSKVSNKSNLHISDSVSWLWEFNKSGRQIDLLYLDSFDFDRNNPYPSCIHHLKELTAIISCLGETTVIAVDDNFGVGANRIGKGQLVEEFMKATGRNLLLYEGYQLLWKW